MIEYAIHVHLPHWIPTRFGLDLGTHNACNREDTAMPNVERNILCPYCGERIDIILDISAPAQEYFEDCFVCCRPILIRYQMDFGKVTELETRTEGET